jgi:3'-5' exoribonuclease
MILSHHGQLEFGSPKLPMFPEALMLHFLDDLDSKMECMRFLAEHDRQVEGCFTTYSNALERSVLKKDRYLAGEAVMPPAPVAPGPDATTPASVQPAPAERPASAPKPDSPFADKLRQAIGKQES